MAERLAPAGRHAFAHGGRTVYEWDQTLADVNVYVPVPPGVRGRDMFCDIEARHLRFGLKGNPPFLDVSGWPPACMQRVCSWLYVVGSAAAC